MQNFNSNMNICIKPKEKLITEDHNNVLSIIFETMKTIDLYMIYGVLFASSYASNDTQNIIQT